MTNTRTWSRRPAMSRSNASRVKAGDRMSRPCSRQPGDALAAAFPDQVHLTHAPLVPVAETSAVVEVEGEAEVGERFRGGRPELHPSRQHVVDDQLEAAVQREAEEWPVAVDAGEGPALESRGERSSWHKHAQHDRLAHRDLRDGPSGQRGRESLHEVHEVGQFGHDGGSSARPAVTAAAGPRPAAACPRRRVPGTSAPRG